MFGATDICAWVDEAHDRARGLGGDVRAAAGYFTSLRLDIPFEIVPPPAFPNRPSRGLRAREPLRLPPYPILSRMSSRTTPRWALLRAAVAGSR